MTAPLAPVRAPLPDGFVGLFTTRVGGASEGPYAALNLAHHVADDPRHVSANRALLAAALPARRVDYVDQVHGTRVFDADVRGGDGRQADALVSRHPGVGVAVLVADCMPVLLVEPVAGVVAAAHAGRRGLVGGVLQAAVAAVVERGGRARDVHAVIGPAIGGCCYEVPEQMRDEVAAALRRSTGDDVTGLAAVTTTGTPSLDLPSGARAVLRAAGVGQVDVLRLCTHDDARFFSYRRDGTTGRFAGVVLRRA